MAVSEVQQESPEHLVLAVLVEQDWVVTAAWESLEVRVATAELLLPEVSSVLS
jgi:hypothetical protein